MGRLKFSLRTSAVIGIVVTVTTSSALAWLISTKYVLPTSVAARLERRADYFRHALNASIDVYLAIVIQSNEEKALQVLRQMIRADETILYIMLTDPDGVPSLWTASEGHPDNLNDYDIRTRIADEHWNQSHPFDGTIVRVKLPLRFANDEKAATAAMEAAALEALDIPLEGGEILDARGDGATDGVVIDGSIGGVSVTEGPMPRALPDVPAGGIVMDGPDDGIAVDDTYLADDVVEIEPFAKASTEPSDDEAPQGFALVALSPAPELSRISQIMVGMSALLGLLAVLALWVFFGVLYRRITVLHTYAMNVAAGDLTAEPQITGTDEIAQLGRSIGSIAESLGQTIKRVGATGINIDELSTHVRDISQQLAADADDQVDSVKRTAEAMSSMSTSARAVETRISEATASTEHSVHRLQDITGAVSTVNGLISEIAQAVEQTKAFRDQTDQTLSRVHGAVTNLDKTTVGITDVSSTMVSNIKTVRNSTERALKMAELTAEKADDGSESVRGMVKGTRVIRDFTTSASGAVERLAERIRTIENVLDIISDIANQTRLLSLNAGIISVQAGEHGRSFRVVADEIKALAAKTGQATHEIGKTVGEVLEGLDEVTVIVTNGISSVDEGVARSEIAETALDDIARASKETDQAVRAIVAAMTEQSAGTERLTQAMDQFSSTTHNVQQSVEQQQTQSRALAGAMGTLGELIDQAVATTHQQEQQAHEGIDAIRQVFERIKQIAEDNQRQERNRQDVNAAVERLRGMAQRHRDSAKGLLTTVEKTAHQSQELVRDLKAYKI